MCSKDADRLADQSDLGLLFLIRFVITKTLDDYGKCQWPDAQWNFYLYFSSAVSGKTSGYCHSPGVVVGGVVVQRRAKTLTFYNISIITEDIYLKLRIIVHYQKGNPYQ